MADAAVRAAAASDPALTLLTPFEGRALMHHLLDYDLRDGVRELAGRPTAGLRALLDQELAHRARTAPTGLLETLLDAGASADVLGPSGYPFCDALLAGSSDAARLLLSRMRSPSAIRDAIGDAILASPRTGQDRLQGVVVALAVALRIQPAIPFLECSRDGRVDPATTRGILPLLTPAAVGAQDPFVRTLRAVLVPTEPSRIAGLFADAGADVRAHAAKQHVRPATRALALLAFRDVPWTAIRPLGTAIPDVRELGASLAKDLRVSAYSVCERLVVRHEPDGTEAPIAAAALTTPEGPFVPRHVVDATHHTVRLRVKDVRPSAVERVDVIMLEPAPAPVLSEADQQLVATMVARVG